MTLPAKGVPVRRIRRRQPLPPFHCGTYRRQGILRLAFLALVAALAAGPRLVGAHEPWVLSQQEMEIIRGGPLPPLFATINPINTAVALLTLGLGWVWFIGDQRLGRVALVQQTTGWLRGFTPQTPLVLRVALSVLLLWGASKGALFVPELRLHDADAPWLVWPETGLAVLLVTGIFPRIAAALVLALEAVGLALFGWGIVPYAGIVAGPACYLLARGNGQPSFRRWSSRGWVAWLTGQTWAHAHTALRVLVGLNLIYLGIAIKYLTPGLFTAVVVRYQFPTFGFPPEFITLCAAAMEGGAGLALVLGLLPRVTAVLLALSFAVMTALLQEDVLGHTIFFGIALAILIEGKDSPVSAPRVPWRGTASRGRLPAQRDRSHPAAHRGHQRAA